MKILLLTSHLNFGGISSYTVFLAKALKSKGHTVYVVSGGGTLAEKLEHYGIPHYYININTKTEVSLKVVWASIKVASLVKKHSIDIIHAQTRVTQVVACWVSFFRNIPYITTCHGFFKPKLFRKIFKCWGYKTIAISDAVREHLVNDFKLRKTNIELIYNGIDLTEFKQISGNEKALLQQKYNLSDENRVIGIIARLSIVKGHKYLLEAFKIIKNEYKNIKLIIVGDGNLKSDLIKQAELLDISNDIIFINSVLDTSRILSILNIFVLPSVQEGLGLAIIEALAMKIPVVATNVGGIYSVIKDGKTGVLVPPKDPGALASGIKFLLENKNIAEELASNGHMLVYEKFSLAKMIEKVEEAYQTTIDEFYQIKH